MGSRRRVFGRWMIVAGLVASMSATITTSSATAVDVGTLGVTGFDDLLLDEVNGRLFVSQGLDAGPIVVTDLAGTQTATLAGTENSRRLTLSHDGATLWVPLPRTNEIVGYSTATLAETFRHDLGADVCPGSIAPTTGPLLAVGHSCYQWASGGAWGGVGVLDTSTGVFNDLIGPGPGYRPLVASSPGSGDLIVAGDIGLSPTTLYTITTLDGWPDVVTSRYDTGGNLRGLAVSPDGGRVMQASGAPYAHNAYSVPFLDDSTSFPSETYPVGAGWSADGRIAVSTTDVSGTLRFHDALTGDVLATHSTGRPWLDDGTVDVSADGTTVFLVSSASSVGGPYVLERFDLELVRTFSLRAASLVEAGGDVILYGDIDTVRDPEPPWDVTITDETGAEVATAVVGTDGRFTVVLSAPPVGSHTYTASIAGDPLIPASSTSVGVIVGYSPSFAIDAPASADLGVSVTVSGSITYPDGPAPGGLLTVSQYLGTADQFTVAVAADGTFSFTDVPAPESSGFDLRYEGDGGVHFPGGTFVYIELVPTIGSTLTLGGPVEVALGDPVTLNGVVIVDDPVYGPPAYVEVYGGPAGAQSDFLGLRPVDPGDGSFSIMYVPGVAGPWIFTARFDGAPYYLDAVDGHDVQVVAPVATSITIDAGPSLRVGEQGLAQGTLTDAAGAPLADRDVWISTSDPTYGYELVQTNGNGAFRVGFVPHTAGPYEVTAMFHGEPGFLGSVASDTATVERWLTTTVVSSPPTATAGSIVTISGSVTADDPAAPTMSGQATVRRTNGSATVAIGSVPVGSDGSFSLGDTIPASATGDVVYEVTFYPTGVFAGSIGTSVTSIARAATETTLTATALAKKFKGSYDLVATLDRPAGGTIVITATPEGGSPAVIATGAGPLGVRVAPEVTTTYVASFAGDAAHQPSSASLTIEASSGDGGKGGGKGGGKPR